MLAFILYPRLLCAEGAHGFYRCGSSCRQEAGNDCGSQKKHSDRGVGGEIEGLHVEKHALHGPSNEICAEQAESETDCGEEQAVTNNEADHLVAAGAKSHPECNFMRSLGHGEGHDAINTERGEK
jgi:hypothetical protein